MQIKSNVEEIAEVLVGKTIIKTSIQWADGHFILTTDEGDFTFSVGSDDGITEFHDFHNEANLDSSKITEFEEIDLGEGDLGYEPESGEPGWFTTYSFYRLTAEHPVIGKVETIFSVSYLSDGWGYGGLFLLYEDA